MDLISSVVSVVLGLMPGGGLDQNVPQLFPPGINQEIAFPEKIPIEERLQEQQAQGLLLARSA